tara:strand:- start:94 stop:1512 length:1419 start_codon:yes stop_codon:yes gene_type:complete
MIVNKTKIIATIGPSSNDPEIIDKMIKKGMNVARINMAHSVNDKDVTSLVNTIRSQSSKSNQHVSILMDIAGPKIRVNLTNNNDDHYKIVKNRIYTIGYTENNDMQINMDINFKKIKKTDSLVKIDDGKIIFKVLSLSKNTLKVRALNTGIVTSNKGINFPGVDLNIPSITSKDKKHIKLGLKLGVDWFALSFVRSKKDFDAFVKLYNKNYYIPVIAKVEKPEAIENLDQIIESFDGILIARGDLGVEMQLSKLPVIQKDIIKKCRLAQKPVIIATQILESMILSSIPTRAEVNDVANAVYEQVDAVMLSGETAIGKYPIEVVNIMKAIILEVENKYKDYSLITSNNTNPDYRNAIGNAVKTISNDLNIDAIVVMTESGSTSRIVSHFRPIANIFSLSPHLNICNKMSLYWGVIPIFTKKFKSTDQMLIHSEKILLDKKYMKKGETFVMTAGVPIGITGSTNMLKIQKIDDN